MKLDAATFLAQWATGGLAFGWVTTRRREVGLGYGWLIRIVFGLLGAGSVVALVAGDSDGAAAVVQLLGSIALVLGAAVALTVSVVGRRADDVADERRSARRRRELAGFDPRYDLLAPVAGVVALVAAAVDADASLPLSAARLLVGAAFLGCVSDAMLLGHWYLVQPGLGREPVRELVRWLAWIWPVEVAVFLIPDGMLQVLSGSIDDGWGGLLGWIWLVSALTTIVLAGVTWAALRERYYSAVMAATGLLYLAILTAFGTDLIAQAVLST
jgi:hypothetical protein